MSSIGDNKGPAGAADNAIDVTSSDTEEVQYDGSRAYKFGRYAGSLRANRVQVPYNADDTQEQSAVVTPIKRERVDDIIHMQDLLRGLHASGDHSEDDSSRFSGGQVNKLRHSSSSDESLFSHSSDDMPADEGPGTNAILFSSKDKENVDKHTNNSASDDESLFSHIDEDLPGIQDSYSQNEGPFPDEEQIFVNTNDVGRPAVKRPRPVIPCTLVSSQVYPVVLQEYEEDSYFSLKWGSSYKIRDSLFKNGPPPLEIADEGVGIGYEIFHSELKERKCKTYNEDGKGKKYFRSFYRRKEAGLNLAHEFDRIADFKSLTLKSGPQKTASRIKLLACSACNLPGSSKTKKSCIHELDADLFEIIEDNGHLGCGFVPLEFLHKNILGNSTAANRAFAIQVRIVSPTKIGVAKGVLVAKEGIDKILIPRSMIKVGPSTLSLAHVLHSNVVLIVKQVFPYTNNITMQRLVNPSHPNCTFKVDPSESLISELKPLPDMTKTILYAKGCPKGIVEQYETDRRRDHANLVGVTDPTGCIPEGYVFITGFGVHLPEKVFISVHPATEASDGKIVPVADATRLPAQARLYLDKLNFGAIVFPRGPEETLIPPKLDDADLDGDLFIVIWNTDIIASLEDSETPDIEAPFDHDNVVGTEFQTEIDGKMRPAVVVSKVGDDVYLVDIKNLPERRQMTKQDIYKGTSDLEEITDHRLGSRTQSTKFELKWLSGKKEWATLKRIRSYWRPNPYPDLLVEYAHQKGLLGASGPKDCKELRRLLPYLSLIKVKDHRLVQKRKIKVLCEYDTGVEEWEPFGDVAENGKLELARYANENGLFNATGWKKTRDYWFQVVQDMFCNETRSNEIINLIRMLHNKYKHSLEAHGPNCKDSIIWGRAYKLANNVEKHGDKVHLPLEYHRQVNKRWENYIAIA